MEIYENTIYQDFYFVPFLSPTIPQIDLIEVLATPLSPPYTSVHCSKY